ncbi:hypothetical protein AOLI_G00321200 [Acnodon oligacanthus]
MTRQGGERDPHQGDKVKKTVQNKDGKCLDETPGWAAVACVRNERSCDKEPLHGLEFAHLCQTVGVSAQHQSHIQLRAI